MPTYLRGVGGAPGIAFGAAVRRFSAPRQLVDGEPETALRRFAAAQGAAAAKLRALAEQLRHERLPDEAAIFDAQSLLVEDPFLSDEVARRVRSGPAPLETAILGTVAQMRVMLANLDDAYLRDRAVDVDAVGLLILAELYGESRDLRELPAGAIVLADDLTPSEVMALRGGAAGFVIAGGGPTSHTTILARAFGIPAVVGAGDAALAVPDHARLILDGDEALVVVEAGAAERVSYERRAASQSAAAGRRLALRDQPGRLADGRALALLANIGHSTEARAALEHGAEGVGLFRTEFLFLERDAPPGEDEQFAAYRQTLDALAGRPLVVRTVDLGADKTPPYLGLPPEPNPALGTRGLRLCMSRPELFRTQARALLRAAAYGDLRILLPMVATPDDLAWGRAAIQAAAESLECEQGPFRADVPLGVMIETPAAAVAARRLAHEAAFLSIGSNDLAQYTLAADRSSAALMARYSHTAPAVLTLIAQCVEAATAAGVPVGLCGELAATPAGATLLAGLGVQSFSMAPAAIPAVKEALHDVTLAQAREIARQALDS